MEQVPGAGGRGLVGFPSITADNLKRPTGPLCAGCHSVGWSTSTPSGLRSGTSDASVATAQEASTRLIPRGKTSSTRPAQDMSPQATPAFSATRKVNRSPIRLTASISIGRLAIGLDYASRITGSLKIIKLEESSFYYFADGTAHKNRMQGNDFVQSVMYRRGVTCFSCHDAHGTGNYAQLRKPANVICLDCHGPHSPGPDPAPSD